jgi:tellurite resistance protein
MELSSQQAFNQSLIKMAILFYQADGRITLSEQDYLDKIIEQIEWDSPICIDAFVNDVIYQTRTALDAGKGADYLRQLQDDLSLDANKALEVAMAITGVDGERCDEETELLSLLTHKVLARALLHAADDATA